jgi:DNA-binding winged helix-turn-helix (wHTH) protein
LWRDNAFVALPPKSIELLKLLIRKRGEVVLKQEIFDAVWADTFVEDGVLTQNITACARRSGPVRTASR